jgi:hypothetical protein
LKYLHSAILSAAASNNNNNNDNNSSSQQHQYDKIIVICSRKYEGHTKKGIEFCGSLLADETREIIKKYSHAAGYGGSATDITLSFMGNSMGGLIARYAAAELYEDQMYDVVVPPTVTTAEQEEQQKKKSSETENEKVRSFSRSYSKVAVIKLRFGHFITTASPWLGSGSQHSFFPQAITPFLQDFLLFSLGQTGADLFRENDLLYKMATEERYLAPLRACSSRQAFANAYRTDLLVPLSTGLFLCRKEDETRNHEQNHHYVVVPARRNSDSDSSSGSINGSSR